MTISPIFSVHDACIYASFGLRHVNLLFKMVVHDLCKMMDFMFICDYAVTRYYSLKQSHDQCLADNSCI